VLKAGVDESLDGVDDLAGLPVCDEVVEDLRLILRNRSLEFLFGVPLGNLIA
jgi:hypothetical protein